MNPGAPNSDEKSERLDDYFAEWRRLAKTLESGIIPFLEMQDELRKSLAPIVESQQRIQETFKPLAASMENLAKVVAQTSVSPILGTDLAASMENLAKVVRIPRIDLPDLTGFANQLAAFQQSWQEEYGGLFENLHHVLRDLPPRTREALMLLAHHGWYLDMEMPMPSLWRLKEALEKGNVSEAEAALVEYFESRISEIEDSILERFPHRARIIRPAFDAHRNGSYELSIPVLLAQSDGICKEVVNLHMFRSKNRKPMTAIYVEQLAADSFTAALLSPLAEKSPINASEYERPEGFNALNRHLVLHGESLDYASKVNSLKAISLINYVAHALKRKEENS